MTATASANDEDRARALALFKDSAAHYEAGRFAVAAALLEEAYALHPEPKLLYNLGRAREADGDIPGAIEAFEGFLKHGPNAEARADVERRIAHLKSQSPPPAPIREPEAPVAPAEVAPTVDLKGPIGLSTQLDPEPPRRVLPWMLLGSGVAVLGTAATLGILARAQHGEADDQQVQVEAAKLQDAAERKALAANVLFGAGAALTLTGGAWLWFGRRRSTPQGIEDGARAFSVEVGLSRVGCVVTY